MKSSINIGHSHLIKDYPKINLFPQLMEYMDRTKWRIWLDNYKWKLNEKTNLEMAEGTDQYDD